jgi:hypothetical protein
MADFNNYAYAWTDLAHTNNPAHAPILTLCGNYVAELLKVLAQMNVTGSLPASQQPQIFNTYFNADDGHTMVDFWNTDDSDWIVLDPTFDLAMKRASDGHWATAQDANSATVAQNWSAIQYVPLGSYGTSIAKAYYLDYPLLYLNPQNQSPWQSPLPYMTSVPPPSHQYGVYAIGASQSPVSILEDGQPHTLTLASQDGLAPMFQASTVSLPAGSSATITVYKPNCYVFTGGPFCPAGG